jgi:DNA-directed RNA polymerase specialized sigma24 family protein
MASVRVAVDSQDGEEDEADLLRRASEGDRQAWLRLFELCREPLHLFVASRLAEKDRTRLDPDDVLQEVFISAMRLLPGRPCQSVPAFLAWVQGLVGPAIKRLGRTEQREPAISPRGLAAAIEALTPAQREVVVLHHLQGVPLKEIEKRMGCTTTAVSALLARALRKLRENLAS